MREKRLIDADALKKRMFNYYECVNEETGKSNYKGETLMSYEIADMIEDCIDNAPAVDAVEVVRCKDCIYFKIKNSANQGTCDCGYRGLNYNEELYTYPNDFCSYGIRKDSENE